MEKIKIKKEFKIEIKKRKNVEQIAKLVGVSVPTIKNWVDSDNVKIYSYPVIRIISDKLNVNIDELFENDNDKTI